MRSSSHASALVVLAVSMGAALLGAPGRVAAQCEPEPEPPDHLRAAARQHYADGVEASTEDRWMEAREAFQRAYDIAPFAPVVYNLATAQAQTGRLVEAAESYRRFLRRCQSRETPQLRADAQQLLAGVTPRIGRLTLRVRHLAPEVDAIELDGDELTAAVLDSPVPINPGPHRLRVTRRGRGEIENRDFEIEEGERRTLEIALPPAPDDLPGDDDDDGSEGDDTPVIVGVTAGILAAVGLGVGIALGVVLGGQGGVEAVDGTWEPARLPLITW